MSTGMKKKIIIVSLLALILVALILVYVFVIIPLTKEDEKVTEPPTIVEGEGLYLNRLVTIYPEVAETDVTYIEINNSNGSYAFHKYYGEGMDKEEMRFVGYEKLDFDESKFAMLSAYINLPVSYQSNLEECAPMRNLTDEEMAQYGVTEDKCIASYTLGYMDNGEEKFHTVYIGYATFSSETTYYVALKGRNSVYRFHQEGVEQCMLVSMEDYLSPLIFGKYSSVSEAMVNITRFKIGVTDPDKLGQDGYIESLIEIVKTGQNSLGTSNIYDVLYQSKGTGNIVRTGASVENLTLAFTALYTYFSGDKVVAVDPSDELAKKCGLGIDQKQYYITAQFSDDPEDTYMLQISDLIDGYYYAMSNISSEEYPLLIRIPEATLEFLGTDDKTVFEWAGTDVTSLFYEYLIRNEENGEPGMNQIVINVKEKNDDGEIIYSKNEKFDIASDGDGGVKVTQGNGTIYEGFTNSDGNKENQFSDFYQFLIAYPTPAEFNNLTQEEIDALRADKDSIIFQFVARDNDNNLFKYTYYQIGLSLDVMIETCEGKWVNGIEEWGEPQINFNTTLSDIAILRENFEILISGGDVRPEDYMY